MKICRRNKIIFILCIFCAALFAGCGKNEEVNDKGNDKVSEEVSEEVNEEVDEEVDMVIELTKSFKGLDHANPIITQRFGADPYAMVYGDRVYFYMTGDSFEYDKDGNVTENTYSKINKINIVSTADMINFTDHGSVTAAGNSGSAKWAHNSWAPAAAWKEIDGETKFFLYFADAAGGIGVLVSDSPTGPFRDELGKALITRSTPNCGDVAWLFDPAVLVDDDGRAYIYFGGGVPEGKAAAPGTARAVELGADMMSIIGEPVAIDAPYLFEDSGIHKVGENYYYTYCSNFQVDAAGTAEYGFHSGEIISMESKSPLGPFVFKETILKNPGSTFKLSGNNHHCVFSFQNNWYITYHTRVLEQSMGVEKGYRCTHIEEFAIEKDGTIGNIKHTLKGRSQLGYVDAYQENKATCMSVMGGIECVPADGLSKYYGCGNMALGGIDTGDFVKVSGVHFGTQGARKVYVRAKNNSDQKGYVTFFLDSTETEALGRVDIESSEEDVFAVFEGTLNQKAEGVHDIFIVFSGEGYEIETWQFEK